MNGQPNDILKDGFLIFNGGRGMLKCKAKSKKNGQLTEYFRSFKVKITFKMQIIEQDIMCTCSYTDKNCCWTTFFKLRPQTFRKRDKEVI